MATDIRDYNEFDDSNLINTESREDNIKASLQLASYVNTGFINNKIQAENFLTTLSENYQNYNAAADQKQKSDCVDNIKNAISEMREELIDHTATASKQDPSISDDFRLKDIAEFYEGKPDNKTQIDSVHDFLDTVTQLNGDDIVTALNHMNSKEVQKQLIFQREADYGLSTAVENNRETVEECVAD